MKRGLIVTISVLLILIVSAFIWNISHKQIEIDAPTANQGIGMQFTISGRIPSILLKNSSFGIDLFDKNGNSILGQIVNVSAPWWSQFISIPVTFSRQIDTSGIDAETPTCFGKTTLIVGSLFNKKDSYSIPVDCIPRSVSDRIK